MQLIGEPIRLPTQLRGDPVGRSAEHWPAQGCCTGMGGASGGRSPAACALQKMMIERQIRVTPTFLLFRNSEVVHTVTGINESNLRTAVEEQSPINWER